MVKRIGTFMASIFALALLIGAGTLHAEDYETPHVLQPGDVISADVLNEMFDEIENKNKVITSDDLVGSWDCTWVSRYTSYDLDGLSVDPDNIAQWRSDVITFADDGDGTYSFSTNKYAIFSETGRRTNSEIRNSPDQGAYLIINNTLYWNNPKNINGDPRSVNRLSNSKIKIFADDVVVICDKQDLSPNKPTRLSATVAGLVVTLSWTDNISDETGFKIMRKDQLTGTYAEIGTASANATSYTDTLSTTGKYWYRVKATNENGDSLGSNVAKVTISE